MGFKSTSDFFDSGIENKKSVFNTHFNTNASPFLFGDRINRSSSDIEAPPGLSKPLLRANSAYEAVFNAPVFTNNLLQTRPNNRMNDTGSASNSGFIPFMQYTEEDNEVLHENPKFEHSKSMSYFKMDTFAGNAHHEDGRQGLTSMSHFNNGMHSRNPSKGAKYHAHEESNVEIRENLRFIEELLQENEYNEKSIMTNFTLDKTHESSFAGIQSPNLSFTGLNSFGCPNPALKQNHSKTQSEDFSTKSVLKFPMGHGRFCSAIAERKNE